MKLKWMALLILALVLSACGHDSSVTEPVLTSLQQTEQTADSVKETTAESTTEMGKVSETEETDETNDSQTTEAKTMEDVIHIDPAEYSWRDGCYTLMDQENCLIEMVFSKSISSDNTFIAYIVQNRTDQDYTVTIEDVLLNKTVQTNDKYRISVPAASQKMSHAYGLDNTCLWIGYDNIRKLSAKVEIELQDWTVLDSVNCVIDFPEGIPLHFAYGPFRSMRADRQVLRSDESMTLALLGCGKFYAESEYQMTGYLWADNTGNMEIPISISNVSVNGMVVESLSDPSRVLQPGSSCIMEFHVSYSDLDIAEIQSIESVQLQILTSAEENSAGIRRLAGGIWYPLALAQSGQASKTDGEQQVIYDDGLLELSFDHVDVESWNDEMRLTYYVMVSNRRAEGIYLKVVDPFVDGKPYKAPGGWSYVSIRNNGFGPESKGMMELKIEIPKTEEEAVPELSFLLQVCSQGGDSIFYTTSERIILTGK